VATLTQEAIGITIDLTNQVKREIGRGRGNCKVNAGKLHQTPRESAIQVERRPCKYVSVLDFCLLASYSPSSHCIGLDAKRWRCGNKLQLETAIGDTLAFGALAKILFSGGIPALETTGTMIMSRTITHWSQATSASSLSAQRGFVGAPAPSRIGRRWYSN
jgi:hypothetical protein